MLLSLILSLLNCPSYLYISHYPAVLDDSDVESGTLLPSLAHRTRTDKVIVYWVSYLDGLQRVLLFTQDERIAKTAKKVSFSLKCLMLGSEENKRKRPVPFFRLAKKKNNKKKKFLP